MTSAAKTAPVEEVMVSQQSTSLSAPVSEPAAKKAKASIKGDKGNPYYKEELDKAGTEAMKYLSNTNTEPHWCRIDMFHIRTIEILCTLI